MRISKADTGPRMNLAITPQEREVAKAVKAEFKKALHDLEDAMKTIITIREAVVEERPTKEDLKNKYLGRLLRYRGKIKKAFDTFLLHVKKVLEAMNDISDPEMERLQEILISELDELSDGVEAVLQLLTDPDRDGFTKALEGLSAQLEKRQKSIGEVVESQIFGHIEHDILGKMKVSELQFNIRRRARILRQLLGRDKNGIY